MSCTNCDDNKIPLTLATGASGTNGTNGTDGQSVFVAFASDNVGSDFSFTPSDTLDYISFVFKAGSTVTQAEFTTWTKFHGTDGTNGTAGASVNSAALSNGITAIGGTVYPIDSLIIGLDNGTYINAGQLKPDWQILPLLTGFQAVGKVNPEYCVFLGFLYFRGAVDASSSAGATFMSIINSSNITGLGNTGNLGYTFSNIVDNISVTPASNLLKITDSGGGILNLNLGTASTGIISLNSINPISVLTP